MGRWHVGIPHLTRATWMAVALLCVSPPVWGTEFAGQVVGITDGDTLTVLHDGVAQRLRLNGIDCPETAQAYGRQAKDAASALLYGQLVMVHPHGQDRYGRILGDVRLRDGRNVNQELVRDGRCWWYRQYAAGDATLAELEAEARAAHRGLWADPHPSPPWEWRKLRHP